MAYTIETIGALGAVARFVPVVYLGDGTRRGPYHTGKASASLDQAIARVKFLARAANLAEPMWSGWVELDGPSVTPPALRAQHPQGATAWAVLLT